MFLFIDMTGSILPEQNFSDAITLSNSMAIAPENFQEDNNLGKMQSKHLKTIPVL